MLVEGVHFLPDDPPADVAWKLLAVNLSDLAAKGATPVGVLLGYPLGDADWDRAFVRGLGEALAAFDVPLLLGGDTVKGPRVLSLTAIGRSAAAPSRSSARPGDGLWVTGVMGCGRARPCRTLCSGTAERCQRAVSREAEHFTDSGRRPQHGTTPFGPTAAPRPALPRDERSHRMSTP